MRFLSSFIVALLPVALAAPMPTKVSERQLLSGLTAAVDPVTSAVGGTLTGVLNPVTSTVGQVAGAAGSAATGAVGGATGAAGGLLAGILKEREVEATKTKRQLLPGLTGALNPVTSTVGGTVTGVLDPITSTVGQVGDAAGSAVGGAVGGVTGATGGLLGGVLKE